MGGVSDPAGGVLPALVRAGQQIRVHGYPNLPSRMAAQLYGAGPILAFLELATDRRIAQAKEQAKQTWARSRNPPTVRSRCRGLHAGRGAQWTMDSHHRQALYRLRGTIHHPEAA